MPAADLAIMDFQRAHRFGKVTIDKPRPIVACLPHFKMKFAIMGRGRELKDSPLGATFTHHGWDKRLYGTSATIQPATQQRPTSAECSLSSSADLTITLSSQTAKQIRTAP
ncbi:unnamed protein product [Boreogadus saida]